MAADLVDELRALGASVPEFGTDDWITACAGIYDAVDQFKLRHPNDDDLNAAVAASSWRLVTERRVWARKNGDVSMLEAVTLALWGANQGPGEPSVYVI